MSKMKVKDLKVLLESYDDNSEIEIEIYDAATDWQKMKRIQYWKSLGNSTFPRLVCEGGYRDLKRNHRSESGLFPPFSGLPVPVIQTWYKHRKGGNITDIRFFRFMSGDSLPTAAVLHIPCFLLLVRFFFSLLSSGCHKQVPEERNDLVIRVFSPF